MSDDLSPDDVPLASYSELKRIRVLLVLILLLGLTIAFYFARDVLLPIILGVMLALTLSPLMRATSRLGVSPVVAAPALILVLALGLGAAGYAASGPVAGWLERAPEIGEDIEQKLRGLTASVERVKEASDQVEEMADNADGEASPQRVVVESPGLLNTAASYATTTATTVAVALVLSLFLLASGDMFTAKIVEAYPRLSDKKRALRIVRGVERAISRYLLTITLINAGLGVAVGLLMWLAGMPSPYVWGVVAFVFNFLPFLGAIAGVILVGAVSLLTFDTAGQAMVAPALYLLATSLEGHIVTPTILGRRLQLNTVSVFVTVVFWGWLWGIAGALMAVPFLVIVKVICDNIEGMRTLGSFLGGADTSVPEARAAPA